MLLFHEGLPGSGKSYAAIKDYVVPNLIKGRKVFAYIEGLNHAQIALLAAISEDRARELLIQLDAGQVPAVYDHVENDAFVIIDELQDFWPSTRTKLGPDITKFITQHRHRGLDVLCMGQVLNDCHNMWRNRVDQNVFFYNRDAVGKPNEYKWSVRKRQPNGKFGEVATGTAPYDHAYFGTYASHTDGTENVDKLADDRANIWKSPILRKKLPIYGGVALLAIVFLIWAFKGGGLVGDIDKKGGGVKVSEVDKVVPPVRTVVTERAPAPVAKKTADDVRPPNDFVDDLTLEYRIRAGGMLRSGDKRIGWVEWRDRDNGVREVLSFNQLSSLGWFVMVSAEGDFVTITKLDRKYIATTWPVRDYRGKVSESNQEEIKG